MVYLFDWCCGMKELGDAGTLLRVDLNTGQTSDPVTLTPSPLPSPRAPPITTSARLRAWLDRSCFTRRPRCSTTAVPLPLSGSIRGCSTRPWRRWSNFSPKDAPVVQYTDPNDRLYIDLVDLTVRPPRVELHLLSDSTVMVEPYNANRLAAGVMVDHNAAPDVIPLQITGSGSALILRVSDGRTMSTSCIGGSMFSDGRLVICGTNGTPVVPTLLRIASPSRCRSRMLNRCRKERGEAEIIGAIANLKTFHPNFAVALSLVALCACSVRESLPSAGADAATRYVQASAGPTQTTAPPPIRTARSAAALRLRSAGKPA